MNNTDNKKRENENSEIESSESKELLLPETTEMEGARGEEKAEGDTEDTAPARPGFLDLVYGVLFNPVKTFKNVVVNPPLGQVVLIYFLLNLLSNAMTAFVNTRNMSPSSLAGLPPGFYPAIQDLIPLLILGGLVLQFIKWFVYSGLLHLIADFFGGKGAARGVFTVAGLAALPGIFLIPFQLLGLTGITESMLSWLFNLLIAIVSFALYIWGVILLILGIREVHGISTGKAVGVVLTPVLVVIALSFVALLVLLSVIAALPQNIPGLPI